MKAQIETVTPALAREWLERNTINRTLRRGWVEQLRASFERGEYEPSHQGIAFDMDGNLLDGQHRLAAIAGMNDGRTFPMLVTRELERERANAVIDIGAKRSTSDVLGLARDVVETARLLVRIRFGQNALTPAVIGPVADRIAGALNELTHGSGVKTRIWTAASVRAAGVLLIMAQPAHAGYVRQQYHALVVGEFPEMSSPVQALYRAGVRGTVRAGHHTDLFARCWRAFDPRRSDNVKVQISDIPRVLDEARVVMDGQIFATSKPARAARSATSREARP